MTKTLILSSDQKLSTVLRVVLSFNSFHVHMASSSVAADKLLSEIKFDVIVMDMESHEEDAFRYTRELKQRGHFIPVLFIGKKELENSMIMGCTGLDEFLVKPFSFQQFRSALNRTLDKSRSDQKPLMYGDIHLDIPNRLLTVKDKVVSLGRLEMKILMILSKKAGKVVALDRLQSMAEAEGARFNKTIFYYISTLRKKLDDLGIHALKIDFVNDGYRLEVR